MKEKTLLKVSLIITLAGITILFIMSQSLDINEKIISTDNIGKDVKITGLVTRITDKENVMFIEISKPDKINACIFKNKINNIDIKVNDKVTVEGEIEEYKGNLELIINKIKK
ncbi:MAG: OB-fold nucleic acid binding domain-containing protein [Nanoarchaeota archaeon]|nr:OB-fold nucleic acid binding domain-containing protein [Nanoarchaeota archaeon]